MSDINKKILLGFWYFVFYVIAPMIAAWYMFNDLLFNAFAVHPTLIFITLAAILNAVMDSIENEHISITVFNGLNPLFWSKRVSWNNAKKILNWKLDAWHICKSVAGVCLILAIVFYKPMFGFGWDFVMFLYWWVHVFNGCYSHLFIKFNS